MCTYEQLGYIYQICLIHYPHNALEMKIHHRYKVIILNLSLPNQTCTDWEAAWDVLKEDSIVAGRFRHSPYSILLILRIINSFV
jgi:hypothetical protein